MDEMRKQAMRFGSEVVNGFVHDVKLKSNHFHLASKMRKFARA